MIWATFSLFLDSTKHLISLNTDFKAVTSGFVDTLRCLVTASKYLATFATFKTITLLMGMRVESRGRN